MYKHFKIDQREVIQVKTWKIWKTIKFDTSLETTEDFLNAFKAKGCDDPNFRTRQMLDVMCQQHHSMQIVYLQRKVKTKLVNVSTAELGFPKGADRNEIYQRAEKLGLDICFEEVGPQLLLQHTNQPRNSLLNIAMPPIYTTGGVLVFQIFCAEDGQRVLSSGGESGIPGAFWDADVRWVFTPRKFA